MASYGFHSEAAEEYLAATRYYLDKASPLVAAAFVAEIEAAIQTLLAYPTTWPVIERPQIRRYLLRRFPYSLYYRWELEHDRISIYAVMHFSRRPGYWRDRIST
jgi:toxin ParE1/3/4